MNRSKRGRKGIGGRARYMGLGLVGLRAEARRKEKKKMEDEPVGLWEVWTEIKRKVRRKKRKK